MKNLTANDYLKFSLCGTALIIALSCGYYFAFYLPHLNQEKLHIQTDEMQQAQKQANDSKIALESCLSAADADYRDFWNRSCKNFGVDKQTNDCILPGLHVNAAYQRRQQSKDNCFKQYPQK